MILLFFLIVLFLLFGGVGFAYHAFWIVAFIVLIFVALSWANNRRL